MSRIVAVLALFLLASTASAGETLIEAYRWAKRLRGDAQKEYAAKTAPRLAPGVSGRQHLYLGYLWSWAEQWPEAARSFDLYVAAAPGSKNSGTAMLQHARALVEARQWGKVPSAVERYKRLCPGQAYTGRMLFYLGRARRAEGRLESAGEAFAAAGRAGYELGAVERIDTLIQLGRHAEARKAARDLAASPRTTAWRKGLANLGKPLPALAIDHWTARKRALGGKPTVFVFWSTKAGKSVKQIHAIGNDWAKRAGGKAHVLGPMAYLRFDPTTMKSDDEMSEIDEQHFVDGWASEYDVAYPLVLMANHALHDACGVDPRLPILPVVAMADAEGTLRYIRIIDGPWAQEAADSMLARLLTQ